VFNKQSPESYSPFPLKVKHLCLIRSDLAEVANSVTEIWFKLREKDK